MLRENSHTPPLPLPAAEEKTKKNKYSLKHCGEVLERANGIELVKHTDPVQVN